MTAFSRLTLAVTLLVIAAWVYAGPPQVIGNRPVELDPEVPGTEPATPRKNATATARQASRTTRKTAATGQPATSLPVDPRIDPQGDPRADRPVVAAIWPDEAKDSKKGAAAGELNSATAQLTHAREQVKRCTSISAKVVEKIEVLEKSYTAEGRYLQTSQKPNDWRMRFELVVKIGKSEGSLMEVCDGEILWTRLEIDSSGKPDKKLAKEQKLMRRNITEIMSAARKLGDLKFEDRVVVDMGLGGLPALIAAIQQDMKFETVTESTLRDRPVSIIHGTWSDAFAQRLRGGPQQPAAGAAQAVTAMLPAFVPDAVRIYVDRETGFPHRIMYLKKLMGRDVHKPMVTLDFLDVVLNQPISQQEFDYQAPENVQVEELTKLIVDKITPPESKPQTPGAKAGTP